jgi:hypothetical protein
MSLNELLLADLERSLAGVGGHEKATFRSGCEDTAMEEPKPKPPYPKPPRPPAEPPRPQPGT